MRTSSTGAEQTAQLVSKKGWRNVVEPAIVEKLYLNDREVSARYGLGRQLRMMRLRDKRPLYITASGRLGKRAGRVLYPPSNIEAWLARYRAGGGQPT